MEQSYVLSVYLHNCHSFTIDAGWLNNRCDPINLNLAKIASTIVHLAFNGFEFVIFIASEILICFLLIDEVACSIHFILGWALNHYQKES